MRNSKINTKVNALLLKLKTSELEPIEQALEITDFLISVIKLSFSKSTPELVTEIREIALKMVHELKNEFTIGNTFRRILGIVRGHDAEKEGGRNIQICSLIDDFEKTVGETAPPNTPVDKHEVIQEILDLKEEISSSSVSASGLAADYIHSQFFHLLFIIFGKTIRSLRSERVMTFGYSEMVFRFLKQAARFRKFDVFVAEATPKCDGRRMASELAESGIDTTLIPDCCVFATMARMDKVIFTPRTAFATGDIIAAIGAKAVLQAARHHAVTVVALFELFKLSSKIVPEQSFAPEMDSPSRLFGFDSPGLNKAAWANPATEFVPSELIGLCVTGLGGFVPHGLSRVAKEIYDSVDRDI